MIRRIGTIVVIAVALGVAAGRFATFDRAAGRDARVATRVSPAQRVAQLEETARRDPDDVRTLQALGAAYVQSVATGGDVALYNQADAVLADAEALAPGDPTTVLTQGYLALARHDFGRARFLGTL